MKKILFALFLTVTSMFTSHTAGAADMVGPIPIPPQRPLIDPPPFIPGDPPTQANPQRDLDELMKLLTDGEEEKAPKATACKTHPCVMGYRFSGRVDSSSASKFEKFMTSARGAGADIVMVEINTPGGSISDGHEISRLIENAPLTVACVVDGAAYSMGMYILQSCDVRVMTKRSSLMIHQAALITGSGTRLTQKNMGEMRAHLTVVTRGYIEWVAHRLKVSVGHVLSRVSDGSEWYISWEEALKIGAVDKAIDGPPEAYFKQLTTTGRP